MSGPFFSPQGKETKEACSLWLEEETADQDSTLAPHQDKPASTRLLYFCASPKSQPVRRLKSGEAAAVSLLSQTRA